MDIRIEHGPAYSMAVCRLAQGEAIRAESGAMVSQSASLRVETSAKMGQGGLLKGLARKMLTGESFFMNVFHAEQGPGEVCLAPANVGDVARIDLDGELFVQSSCYLASHPDVDIQTKVGGFKNWFGGKGFFMLKASGRGPLLLSAFGAVHAMDLQEPFIIDTGHIVAFEPTLDFSIRRVGGWFSTFFSGEGFVCEFSGRGRLLIQTRNPVEFGRTVGPRLPPM
ncbi:MAG: TIGR00266 family protein [Deltaproteobacteria bacterium]|nr:TIGR00266 family protein [Deltaproteobacteria bacterium]